MTLDHRILELLQRWQTLRDQGQTITPEQLCQDCPELLEEIKNRIDLAPLPRPATTLTQRTAAISVQSSVDPDASSLDSGPADQAGAPAGSAMRYRQEVLHAAGGLGKVYKAQDTELGRPVALKRMKEGAARRPDCRRRFLREAEITGRLEHPGIVPVYGLVRDEQDQPCYAMRFIEGQSFKEAIHQFHEADRVRRDAGERSLALRQLLNQFIAVCKTIAYAHSRGYLHRDLKPANIMLGRYGETLVVDWGLARAFGEGQPVEETDAAGRTEEEDELVTAMGDVMGTPGYMSPEQAKGRWDIVGPASDIYSLGGTLYTLLTGETPHSKGVDHGALRPPRAIKPSAPRPLAAICLKALAAKPEDRYAGAMELAEEVEHWLADESVAAWPEPWTARARRWFKRHRTIVSTAAGVVIVAILCLVLATLFLAAAKERERDAKTEAQAAAAEARIHADNTQKFASLLADLFAGYDDLGLKSYGFQSAAQRAEVLPARQVLERFAQRVRTELSNQPEFQAVMLDILGNVYRSLAEFDKARSLLQEALVLRQRLFGDENAATALTLFHLGWLEHDLANYDEAEQLYTRALRIQKKVLPEHDDAIADTLFNLAWLKGRMELEHAGPRERLLEAESLFQQVLHIRRQQTPQNRQHVSFTLMALVAVLHGLDKYGEALVVLAEAGSHLQQDGGQSTTNVFFTFLLAEQARKARKYDEAERLHRQVLERARRKLGDRHPIVAMILGSLAGLLRQKYDLVNAEKAIREALDIGRNSLLRWHPLMIDALIQLADHVKDRDGGKEAEQLLREALAAAQRRLPHDKDLHQKAVSKLAALLQKQGRTKEAEMVELEARNRNSGP